MLATPETRRVRGVEAPEFDRTLVLGAGPCTNHIQGTHTRILGVASAQPLECRGHRLDEQATPG
eukprot:scaffold56311_cov74-Phaeocystis_antarctica.AAC.1